MCEPVDSQAAGVDERLVRYLASGRAAVDTTIDKIIECGITIDDLEPVTDYLSALIAGAYQVTVRAMPHVHAHLTRLNEDRLSGPSVFSSLYHVMNLIEATSSFIDAIERELTAPAEPEPAFRWRSPGQKTDPLNAVSGEELP